MYHRRWGGGDLDLPGDHRGRGAGDLNLPGDHRGGAGASLLVIHIQSGDLSLPGDHRGRGRGTFSVNFSVFENLRLDPGGRVSLILAHI